MGLSWKRMKKMVERSRGLASKEWRWKEASELGPAWNSSSL